MMDVDFLPRHLIVVGGSYVGLEFAQMFRRFGSRVTVVEMGPRLIGREDEDVSHAVARFPGARRHRHAPQRGLKHHERKGVAIRAWNARRAHPQFTARTSCSRRAACPTPTISASKRPASRPTSAATSRWTTNCARPIRGLGARRLQRQGRLHAHGVQRLRDRRGQPAQTPRSRKWTDRVPVYALYTDPPLGRGCMNETETRKAGTKALVGKRPMTRVARGRKRRDRRVPQDPRRAGLAAHPGRCAARLGADESVHSLIDLVYARTPIPEFQRRVRIHPNVSELLPFVLEDAEAPMRMLAAGSLILPVAGLYGPRPRRTRDGGELRWRKSLIT